MNCKLVKLTIDYKTQLVEMVKEWKEDIYKNNTNRSPWVIFKNDCDNFEYYLANIETSVPHDNLVPDSTLFLLDMDRNIFVGAVNIRHYLNDGLLKTGGHIGDGIRPSERRKGYGKILMNLALKECKKLGINKVLVTCNDDNIGSKKCIISNGGILENKVESDGDIIERYWINLD